MDLQCRDCGEWWVATEHPATWGYSGGEPACIHPGECPLCDGNGEVSDDVCSLCDGDQTILTKITGQITSAD